MERFFTNKRIWKMLIVAFLLIMAVQVLTPMKTVYAAKEEDETVTDYDGDGGDNILWGGVLIRPVLSLLVTIGDGIMNILHSTIMGVNASLIHIDLHEGNWLWTLIKDVIMGAIIGVTALLILALAGPEVVIGAAAAAVIGTVVGVPVIDSVQQSAIGIMHIATTLVEGEDTPEDLYLPIYSYSPEEIFKGKILLFNVNFFGNKIKIEEKRNKEGNLEYYYYLDDNSSTLIEDKDGNQVKGYRTSQMDSAAMLKNTVSQWYVVLRNICIVAMLSVLIYIGIRMMLTSIASDKAKYKEMLKDWLVGLCLLFVIHYIMAFSVTLVQKFTDMISTSMDKNMYTVVLHAENGKKGAKGITGKKLKNLKKVIEEQGLEELTTDENGDIVWATNLMGKLRLSLQFGKAGGQYIGELLCFLALVLLTIMFTFTYFKRLLYMAFLTIIAPFVALTYCIDKVNDGQAQGFNTWLKEYIFNLLLQPVHLLIYFILVTSAFNLSGTNVLYSIAVLLSMLPAEKLLRNLFGFQKAHTPPLLGGPMGTALIMQGISKLTGAFGGKGGKQLGGSSSNSSLDSSGESPSRTREAPGLGEILAGTTSDTMESLDEEQQELLDLRAAQSDENGQLSDADRLAYWEKQNDLNRRRAALVDSNNTNSNNQLVSPRIRALRQGYENFRDRANNLRDRTTNRISNSRPVRFANTAISGARGRIENIGRSIDSNMNELAPQHWSRIKWGAQVAGTYAKNQGKQMLKQVPGAIAGGVVGVTAAGIGAAAGIASGDTSKTLTGAAAGAAAGVATARSMGEFNSDNLISPELREAIEEVNNSNPEYKDNNMEAFIKKARKDDGIWKQLESMDKETADEMKENGHFEDYLRLGYGTDKKGLQDMIASEKMINDNSSDTTRMIDSTEKVASVRKTTNRMGNINQMTSDKEEKWHNTFSKEYGGGENADNMATQTINLAKAFDKARPH